MNARQIVEGEDEYPYITSLKAEIAKYEKAAGGAAFAAAEADRNGDDVAVDVHSEDYGYYCNIADELRDELEELENAAKLVGMGKAISAKHLSKRRR